MSISSFAAELPPALAHDVDEGWRRVRRYLDTGAARNVAGAQARAVSDRLWRRVVEHPHGARPEIDPRVVTPLAALYWFRHDATDGADPTDLDRSLGLFRRLVRFTDLKLVPPRPMARLAEEDEENGLAEQLNRAALRFLRGLPRRDAPQAHQEAVSILRRAVEHAVPSTTVHARLLTNLAGVLLVRYKLDSDPAGVREAAATARRAVEVDRTFGIDRAAAQAAYATALVYAARLPGPVDDASLRSALDHAQGAVLSLDPAHPARAGYETTLVGVARSVFELTGEWADLQLALDLADHCRGG
ncbi:hypothetical protein [Actinoplanes sp. NPDC049118]|uniref:hypothetical protein n=1 Tax=Actinoplanes sp. NPDC049118 TaxID=3155769 RepID=UPI0033DB54EA